MEINIEERKGQFIVIDFVGFEYVFSLVIMFVYVIMRDRKQGVLI